MTKQKARLSWDGRIILVVGVILNAFFMGFVWLPVAMESIGLIPALIIASLVILASLLFLYLVVRRFESVPRKAEKPGTSKEPALPQLWFLCAECGCQIRVGQKVIQVQEKLFGATEAEKVDYWHYDCW